MKLFFKKTLSAVLIFIIFFLISKVIYKEWDKISNYNWSPQFSWLLYSILALFVAYLMGASGWTVILRMIGVKIEWIEGFFIFMLSQMGRYIPGGVWSALSRIYLCRLEGIPDSRSSISIILEQVYPIVSAGLIFAISLLFWSDTGFSVKIFPIVFFLPLFILFLHPKPFLMVVNPIISLIGKGPINITLSFNSMIILVVYYSFYWIVTGIAFYFFIRAFYLIDLYFIPILSGIYAISFVAGFLTFFAPAGLGGREGSLIILLSLFIPTPVAIGVAILSRLWVICIELIILLLFLIDTKTRKMVRTALGW